MIDQLLWVQKKMTHLAAFYLDKQGHFSGKVADGSGAPTPWFTYPALAFLDDILEPSMRVFEYGAGNSTIYFHRRCAEVLTVEHDAGWAEKLRDGDPSLAIECVPEGAPALPLAASSIARFLQLGIAEVLSGREPHDKEHGLRNVEFAGYASRLFRRPQGYFDLIVADGMARGLTMYLAAEMVHPDGFIVLDNSDRWQYNAYQQLLIDAGFGRVDFWGPGPINDIAWCTSFFSRRLRLRNLHPQRPRGSGDLSW